MTGSCLDEPYRCVNDEPKRCAARDIKRQMGADVNPGQSHDGDGAQGKGAADWPEMWKGCGAEGDGNASVPGQVAEPGGIAATAPGGWKQGRRPGAPHYLLDQLRECKPGIDRPPAAVGMLNEQLAIVMDTLRIAQAPGAQPAYAFGRSQGTGPGANPGREAMPDEPVSSGPAQPAERPEHPAPVGTLIGWAEIYNPAWTPSFTQQQADLAVVFTGPCPSCSHQTMFSVPLTRPDVGGYAVRGVPATTFTMYCECGYPHPGHPDGDNSCGAYWPYEAEL